MTNSDLKYSEAPATQINVEAALISGLFQG